MALRVQPRVHNPAPVVPIQVAFAELTLDRQLGGGGFGEVFKGTWRHTVVAIKKLRVHQLAAQGLEELKREAQLMSQLRHPHIVSFYKVCTEPNNYCIVMEFCENGSLFHWLRKPESDGWPNRKRIGLEIARGLSYLHHHDIVHRDLKSLNVLLDKNLNTKISDFGLSKIKTENSLLSSRQPGVIGTLRWNPPELLNGQVMHYSKETDMYSYGMVLWELSSRKAPFEEQHNDQIVCNWIIQGRRETIPNQTPISIEKLIVRCWDQSDKRPTADQAIQALEAEEIPIPAAANPPPLPLNTLPPSPGYYPPPAHYIPPQRNPYVNYPPPAASQPDPHHPQMYAVAHPEISRSPLDVGKCYYYEDIYYCTEDGKYYRKINPS